MCRRFRAPALQAALQEISRCKQGRMDRVSRSNRILDPELLMSAHRRRGKLPFGQRCACGGHSGEGSHGGEGGDLNHESAHGGLPWLIGPASPSDVTAHICWLYRASLEDHP
jgi:hypothetical protein